jgi:hypothetical protein
MGGCADLKVVAVDDAPFTGANLMMKATVKNEGWRAAPATTTRLDVKLPGADFVQRSAMPTPPLAASQQTDVQLWPFNLVGMIGPGQCIEARVCADSADVVWEGWFADGNNCRTKSFCR